MIEIKRSDLEKSPFMKMVRAARRVPDQATLPKFVWHEDAAMVPVYAPSTTGTINVAQQISGTGKNGAVTLMDLRRAEIAFVRWELGM